MVESARIQREAVQALALEQLIQEEGKDFKDCKAVSQDKTSPYFGDAKGYAMHHFSYSQCFNVCVLRVAFGSV